MGAVLDEINAPRADNIHPARKAMILCGLGLEKGVWSEEMLKTSLQHIIKNKLYRPYFLLEKHPNDNDEDDDKKGAPNSNDQNDDKNGDPNSSLEDDNVPSFGGTSSDITLDFIWETLVGSDGDVDTTRSEFANRNDWNAAAEVPLKEWRRKFRELVYDPSPLLQFEANGNTRKGYAKAMLEDLASRTPEVDSNNVSRLSRLITNIRTVELGEDNAINAYQMLDPIAVRATKLLNQDLAEYQRGRGNKKETLFNRHKLKVALLLVSLVGNCFNFPKLFFPNSFS